MSKETEEDDPVNVWLNGIANPQTRDNYERYFKNKLLLKMHMTGQQLLIAARKDPTELWLLAKSVATKMFGDTQGRRIALYGLRSFLGAHDVDLPAAKLKAPRPKHLIYANWQETESIISHAEFPYNLIFRFMLRMGWGAQQFLEFNTVQTWKEIRDFLKDGHGPEYFRVNFGGRKMSNKPFYSLIGRKYLTMLVASGCPLPFTTKYGSILSMEHYQNTRNYLGQEWRNARKATGTTKRIGLHELRDTFQTEGTKKGILWEVKQFTMGHAEKLDPDNYEKCWHDPDYIWSQVRLLQDG